MVKKKTQQWQNKKNKQDTIGKKKKKKTKEEKCIHNEERRDECSIEEPSSALSRFHSLVDDAQPFCESRWNEGEKSH